MKPADNIETLIKNAGLSTNADRDKKICSEMLDAFEESKHKQTGTSRISVWRIIMKNKTTRLATAAAIIIAAITGLSILSITSKPAWAIEQTIEVLKHIKLIHISGYVNYDGRNENSFHIWMRPNSENPTIAGDFKIQEGNNHVSVANEKQNLTYVFTESEYGKVVYISEGLNRKCEPFPGSDFFEQIQSRAQNWQEQYRKDEITGKDSVFVTFEGPAVNTAKYWLIQFDLESKFPVKAAVWFDEKRQGKPHFEYSFIEYNPQLADNFFDFVIPDGTQVIDCRILRNLLDKDTTAGIDVSNMSTEEACKQVTRDYWSAIISNDEAILKKIRPDKKFNELTNLYENDKLTELVEISTMNHINDPGTFTEATCLLKTKNGQIKTSILNIEIRNEPRGQVGAVAGTIGPELF